MYLLPLTGDYCATEGLSITSGPCLVGYYCLSGSFRQDPQPEDMTGGLCPMGHYCPTGTQSPSACPPGTYTNSTGNVDSLDCKQCTEGVCVCV